MALWLKIVLGCSVIVVVILAIVANVILRKKAKALRQRIIEQTQQETYLELSKLRDDIGHLSFALKNEVKNNYKPYDVEAAINTVFTNDFQNILVVDKSDLFLLNSIAQKTKRKTYYLSEYFDQNTQNALAAKYPDDFTNVHLLPYNMETIDFVVVFENDFSLMEIYEKYWHFMSERSMMMILLTKYKNKEIKSFVKKMQEHNYPMEISYVESKFLYLVKKQESKKNTIV
ncbi:BC85_0335 family putative methyltransferase [Mycoplasmopsis sturni]|uniref:BC85_0335 family putative methyltransferase n=1 Tax=Mycoplasmopsis sturni TaxID=39047 RepID=UPI00056D3106|nr:hypothetical protein [Mycoplasmopsis sturni]